MRRSSRRACKRMRDMSDEMETDPEIVLTKVHKSKVQSPEVVTLNETKEDLLETGLANREKADRKKAEGNSLYMLKKYVDAIKLYSEAIDLCPDVAAFYGNRCACYMMMEDYSSAIRDSRSALRLDENYVKGYLRAAKSYRMLGDADDAERILRKGLIKSATNADLISEMTMIARLKKSVEEADKMTKKEDYRSVLYYITQARSMAPSCVRFQLIQAECYVYLGRFEEAQNVVLPVLRSDPNHADALYVRGLLLYYQDNIDKAILHFQQSLRFSPDAEKVMRAYKRAKSLKSLKEIGNELFKEGKYEEALNSYSQALLVDPLNQANNAKLHFNKAVVNAKRHKSKEAIEDCSNAIKMDDKYLKAYLKRAKLYLDSELYEESVRDYEVVFKLEPSREYKNLLDNAKLELKKSKRKDYYKILGVSKNAGIDEIKKAYRKRAMVHHPDRHSSSSEDAQKEEEKKFKDVGEAYAVLSDEKKRSRYDSGADLEDMTGNGGGFEASDIFNMFNVNGMQGGFQFQRGGHSHHPGGGPGFNPFQFF